MIELLNNTLSFIGSTPDLCLHSCHDHVVASKQQTLGAIMCVTTHYIITLLLLAKYDWHVTGYYHTGNSFEMRIACKSNISMCVSG